MDRAKRNIVKSVRFQTTCSDEAPTRKTMDSIKVRNTDDIENDINDLRILADKDPLDLQDGNQNQYSPSVDTFVQQRSNASTCNKYLPPTCSQYITLQSPVHAQYGTYSSQLSSSNIHQMQSSSSTNRHQMQPSTSTNIHAIPYIYDQAYIYNPYIYDQPQPNQRTQPNTNQTMRTNESQHDIDNRNVRGQLDNIETQLRKVNNTVEQILKHLQSKDKRRKAPQKPTLLPIATVEEMINFENIDDETYEEVVNYFHYVGGFTAKKAINVAFKEAVKESIVVKYTWFGREEGVHPLYNTRIIMAIYDSVCNNDYFCKPSRTEFQSIAREALRSAKQRHRTSTRILHYRERQAREARNYWGDTAENESQHEESEESENEESENEEDYRDKRLL